MKRIVVCMLLAVCLLITSVPVSSASSPDINAKISGELSSELEKLGDSESIQVYVFMNDIDDEEVMKTFSERYPTEYETYLKAKNTPIDTKVMPVCEGDVDLKDGAEGKGLFANVIDGDILQKAIEDKRAIYKEYHLANNLNLLNNYCTKDQQIFVSSYAPMAILNVNRNTIMSLAENNDVRSITKFVNKVATPVNLSLANQITRADYVRDHYGNTGSGVKIGMVEAVGTPNTSDSYLTSATIYKRPRDTVTDSHATRVAKILVGTDSSGTNDGLAPDATLYCCIGDNALTFYSGVEWLIDRGVNVINASLNFEDFGYGTYDEISEWVDLIACIDSVHYVNAAGNSALYIESPGMAYNAITVGGLNDDGDDEVVDFFLPSFTSYEESGTSRPEKPNLVAPAVDIFDDDGTSYAAPQVAGTIAQLCSYNSALKTKQTAMGAILAASSAEKVQATGNGGTGDTFASSVRINAQISEKEGAGILDSRWARGIVYYGNYWSYTIYQSSFPYNKYVTINASTNSVTRVAIFWLKRPGVSFTDLDLYVYDPNNNPVGSSITTKSNFEIVQFIPTVTGTYKINIRAYGCEEKEHVGIAVW